MIQFNIQFKMKSKIFIQTFIHSIWKKIFKITSGLKHVITAQIRALASSFYAIFHIICPFHTVQCTPVFYILFLTIPQTSKHLFYILFIFPMNDAFFHSFNNLFNFIKKIIHSKNNSFNKNMKLFIQRNYSFI